MDSPGFCSRTSFLHLFEAGYARSTLPGFEITGLSRENVCRVSSMEIDESPVFNGTVPSLRF